MDDVLATWTKMLVDFCKHLTTLSSAAIVVIATFATKTPPATELAKIGYLISTVGFVVCILATMFAMFLLSVVIDTEELKKRASIIDHDLTIAQIGFAVGMCSLLVVVASHLF